LPPSFKIRNRPVIKKKTNIASFIKLSARAKDYKTKHAWLGWVKPFQESRTRAMAFYVEGGNPSHNWVATYQ